MIKLEKGIKPAYLSVEKELELTQNFKDDLAKKALDKSISPRSVWNKEAIKDALLLESHSKCVYCESIVNAKSSYMEVEHFYPKIDNPDLVVSWENLLSSCKRCNGLKGEKVNIGKQQEIINPFIDNPKDHLIYRNNRFRSKNDSQYGERTIDVFDLNNTDRRNSRYLLTDKLDDILNNMMSLSDDYKMRNQVKALLEQVQPTEEYSAILATQVHSSPDYHQVREKLLGTGLWSEEHEFLHHNSYHLVLIA